MGVKGRRPAVPGGASMGCKRPVAENLMTGPRVGRRVRLQHQQARRRLRARWARTARAEEGRGGEGTETFANCSRGRGRATSTWTSHLHLDERTRNPASLSCAPATCQHPRWLTGQGRGRLWGWVQLPPLTPPPAAEWKGPDLPVPTGAASPRPRGAKETHTLPS